MQNYQFTSQHLYGANNRHLIKILENVQGTKQLVEFITNFYSKSPMDSEHEQKPDFYIKLAENAYSFFQKRDQVSKIRVYQEYFKEINGSFVVNLIHRYIQIE